MERKNNWAVKLVSRMASVMRVRRWLDSLPMSLLTIRRPSPRPPPHAPLAAGSAAAEEPIAAVGLEPRDAHVRRHLEPLQDLAAARIDPPQVALVAFPGAVPELAVDPGDAGDEAIGLDGAQDRPRLGIELIDLPVAHLPDPERPFGPCEPRAAARRCRDRAEHAAGGRVDLLDAIVGDLKQMPPVERGAGARRHVWFASGGRLNV